MIDLVRIQRFLNHQLDWAELTRPERSAAVDELQRRQLTGAEVELLYGLNPKSYTTMLSRRTKRQYTPGPRHPQPVAPWIADAPCTGDTRFTVVPIRWEALHICNTCTQRAACLEITDPANSHFDGIAGGIGWQGGRPVTEKSAAA